MTPEQRQRALRHYAAEAAVALRIEQLEAALQGLLELYAMPGESNVDRFERVAAMFYRETGWLAPGKDNSAAACGDDDSYEHRRAAWEKWYESRANAARAALAKAGASHD